MLINYMILEIILHTLLQEVWEPVMVILIKFMRNGGEFTEIQLSLWGCKFHELRLGKPNADYYIDDKGITDEDYFGKLCP